MKCHNFRSTNAAANGDDALLWIEGYRIDLPRKAGVLGDLFARSNIMQGECGFKEARLVQGAGGDEVFPIRCECKPCELDTFEPAPRPQRNDASLLHLTGIPEDDTPIAVSGRQDTAIRDEGEGGDPAPAIALPRAWDFVMVVEAPELDLSIKSARGENSSVGAEGQGGDDPSETLVKTRLPILIQVPEPDDPVDASGGDLGFHRIPGNYLTISPVPDFNPTKIRFPEGADLLTAARV
jgi:hypothetical protein